MKVRPVLVAVGIINAFVLASTFYAWRFSYFWLDDFNNLFWIQRLDQSIWQMLWSIVNPFADAFRPFGMLFYWIFWHVFDLNPLPYHLFAWMLHTMNVCLMFILLRRIVGSSYGAAFGALLFGFRSNFTDIYWSFGTIFELLALLLMLLALLVHGSEIKFHWRLITVALLYLLAVKSKEMAITIPVVLLLYDICFRRGTLRGKAASVYPVFVLFGLIFGYSKFDSLGSVSRSDPYYMDFSVLTLGRGYGWYFDHLYGLKFRWGAWMIAAFVLFVWFIYRRERRGLFFLGCIFITLLPVIFLVNHRYELYWYVPFFGITGLASVLANTVERWLSVRLHAHALGIVGLSAFVVLSIGHYRREWQASDDLIRNQHSLAVEYEAFVTVVRNFPPPPPEAKISFKSLPRYFTSESLLSAAQVVLHRTDIQVESPDRDSDGRK